MAATIINITGTDQALSLAGTPCQAARVLAIGSTWTDIRIGWRWSWEDTAGNIVFSGVNDQPCVGVMASPAAAVANGPLTNGTSNFLGIKVNAGTFVRATVPTRYENMANLVTRRTGAVDTTVAGGPAYMAGTDALRTAFILRITKANPNWTIERTYASYAANGAALLDMPLTGLMAAMKSPDLADTAVQLNAAVAGAGTKYNTATQVIAEATIDEAGAGFLNAIVAGWGKATGMRFSEIAFAQIS